MMQRIRLNNLLLVCYFKKVFRLIQTNFFLWDYSQILRNSFAACLSFGLGELLDLNDATVGAFALFFG